MSFSRWHNPSVISFTRAVADFQSGRDTPSAMLERCLSRISERDAEVRAFVRLNTNARHAADAATAR